MKTTTILLTILALAFLAGAVTADESEKPKVTPVAPPEGNGVNHKVQRGETLSSIAEKYYGHGYLWVKLKEYNRWIDDPDRIPIGEIVYVPDPINRPVKRTGTTSLNPTGSSWTPDLRNMSFFGKSLFQIGLILMVWFLIHSIIQGLFVWFGAHLAFAKDVSIKKAMKATFQSESLAFAFLFFAAIIGMMLLYVATTSPGKPVTPELFSSAEHFLASPHGMITAGLLVVAIYGFLGIRFIPQAFGMDTGRGFAVVMISILLPHLIGFYLVSHRMGIIN